MKFIKVNDIAEDGRIEERYINIKKILFIELSDRYNAKSIIVMRHYKFYVDMEPPELIEKIEFLNASPLIIHHAEKLKSEDAIKETLNLNDKEELEKFIQWQDNNYKSLVGDINDNSKI